jgi:signal transduction histidine kinase
MKLAEVFGDNGKFNLLKGDKMKPHADWKDKCKGINLRYGAWILNTLVFSLLISVFFYLHINRTDMKSPQTVFVVFAQLIIIVGLSMLYKQYKVKDSDLRQSRFELTTIKELTEISSRSFNINHLLKLMLEKAMGVSRSRIGSVFKFDPEKRCFYIIVSKGFRGKSTKGFCINVDESLVGSIISDKKPLLVQDMETDSRIHRGNNPKYGPPSFLSMPIFVRDQLFGVLNLSCKETREIFGPDDEKIMAIITGEIGLSLENVMLNSQILEAHEALKRCFEETARLDELSEKKISEYIRAGHLAVLGEMAGDIAHDINNPVGGIISYAEILKDRFNEKGQDADIPNRIIKESDRVAKIVRSLLLFAQDTKEECCPASFRDILSNTLSLAERQFIKNDIKFSVHVPADLLMVKVRSKEIQQVFLSIIINACFALNQRFPKFSENKFFKINSETLEIDGRKYVRTIFHDGGIGIPEAILDKIFDPFFSTKPEGEGTGLGLSVSNAIIKGHGGNIRVETVEDEYTKIIVDLPTYNGWGKTPESRK